MFLLDLDDEFELRRFANELTYVIHSSIGLTSREIVVNDYDIMSVVEVNFFENESIVSSAVDLVRGEFERFGLIFVRMDSDVLCGIIRRKLYFSV